MRGHEGDTKQTRGQLKKTISSLIAKAVSPYQLETKTGRAADPFEVQAANILYREEVLEDDVLGHKEV